MADKLQDDLSNKMQDYLARIYRLADAYGNGTEFVTTSALAEVLMVTAPAVNRMVNRLKESGLLAHEPYKGIQLTEQGKREALLYLRTQRIAEAFLFQIMKLDWSEAPEEANRISASLNPIIVERMNIMAGEPRFCPHGEPIPHADGTIDEMNDVVLSGVNANSKVVITRIKTREPDRLKYIEALGLTPNTSIEVLHIAPFNGPLQLRIKQEYRIIGNNLADLIRVRVL
jgi:DtxR family transcriptional regulator, Mn-dependent transcriptional regulator